VEDRELWQELEVTRESSWKAADHPRVAAWLDANAGAFAQMREALRRPRYFVPLVRPHEAATAMDVTTGAGALRAWAEALAVRAMRGLGDGDVVEASAAAGDLLQLGTLAGQQPLLIEKVLAIGILERGLAVQGAILAERVLLPGERAILEGQLDRIVVPSLREAVDWHERLEALDLVTKVARFGAGDESPPQRAGAFTFGLLPLHFDPVLRGVNDVMDAMAGALAEGDPAVREAKLIAVLADVRAAERALGSTKADALRRLALVVPGTMQPRTFRTEAGVMWHTEILRRALSAAEEVIKAGGGDEAVRHWKATLSAGPYGQGTPQVAAEGDALVLTAADVMAGAPQPPPSGVAWLDKAAGERKEKPFVVRVRVK
jgi:hypothetical protein